MGQTYDTESNLPSLVGATEAAGVFGRSDKSNGWGVLGWSVNHHGMLGRTDDSNDYGVFAYNSSGGYSLGVNGDADVMGTVDVSNNVNASNVSASNNLSVGGHSDVSNVGLNAYLSSDYTIPDNSFTTLPFDSTTVDHFGGFDTSTGVYTVQEPGDYHVDFLIDWADQFSEGDGIEYAMLINGGLLGGMSADKVAPAATDPAEHFGRTLFGLSSGDTIEVELYQTSGSGKNVWGGSNEQTFLTIHKVG